MLFKEISRINNYFLKYIILFLSLFFLPGNFLSELSVYVKPYLKTTDILSCLRGRFQCISTNLTLVSHASAAIFGLCDSSSGIVSFCAGRHLDGLQTYGMSSL